MTKKKNPGPADPTRRLFLKSVSQLSATLGLRRPGNLIEELITFPTVPESLSALAKPESTGAIILDFVSNLYSSRGQSNMLSATIYHTLNPHAANMQTASTQMENCLPAFAKQCGLLDMTLKKLSSVDLKAFKTLFTLEKQKRIEEMHVVSHHLDAHIAENPHDIRLGIAQGWSIALEERKTDPLGETSRPFHYTSGIRALFSYSRLSEMDRQLGLIESKYAKEQNPLFGELGYTRDDWTYFFKVTEFINPETDLNDLGALRKKLFTALCENAAEDMRITLWSLLHAREQNLITQMGRRYAQLQASINRTLAQCGPDIELPSWNNILQPVRTTFEKWQKVNQQVFKAKKGEAEDQSSDSKPESASNADQKNSEENWQQKLEEQRLYDIGIMPSGKPWFPR